MHWEAPDVGRVNLTTWKDSFLELLDHSVSSFLNYQIIQFRCINIFETLKGCILNGSWEMCQSKDDNSDQLLNRFEPVCFVELRERDQERIRTINL